MNIIENEAWDLVILRIKGDFTFKQGFPVEIVNIYTFDNITVDFDELDINKYYYEFYINNYELKSFKVRLNYSIENYTKIIDKFSNEEQAHYLQGRVLELKQIIAKTIYSKTITTLSEDAVKKGKFKKIFCLKLLTNEVLYFKSNKSRYLYLESHYRSYYRNLIKDVISKFIKLQKPLKTKEVFEINKSLSENSKNKENITVVIELNEKESEYDKFYAFLISKNFIRDIDKRDFISILKNESNGSIYWIGEAIDLANLIYALFKFDKLRKEFKPYFRYKKCPYNKVKTKFRKQDQSEFGKLSSNYNAVKAIKLYGSILKKTK